MWVNKQGSFFFEGLPSPQLDRIDPGLYKLKYHPMFGFFLDNEVKLQDMPLRIYGDVHTRAERILKTFNARTAKNTGVLLSGLKGSGKTLVTRLVMQEAAKTMPVILLQESYGESLFLDFQELLTHKIKQQAVFVIDEFEKVWSTEEQERMLGVLDGLEGGHRLFVLTVNHSHLVDPNMLDRPGRIFYHLEYKDLPWELVGEMVRDRLHEDQAYKALQFLMYAESLSMDIINAVVEELRRYPDIDNKTLVTFMNTTMVLPFSFEVILKNKATQEILARSSTMSSPGPLEETTTIRLSPSEIEDVLSTYPDFVEDFRFKIGPEGLLRLDLDRKGYEFAVDRVDYLKSPGRGKKREDLERVTIKNPALTATITPRLPKSKLFEKEGPRPSPV